MKSSALVVFEKDLPRQNDEWWRKFNVVIAPAALESTIRELGLSFVNIETLIDPGDVQKASELTINLSLLKTVNGESLPKVINYKGFELWWIHYDELMNKFCLPYTQYARLLEYLKSFSSTYLYRPPFPELFKHFLNSYGRKYLITGKLGSRLSLGILCQAILSIPFLLWLKIIGPRLMVWTSDKFDPPRDHDFRMRFIYEELKNKKINFVEFIRSMEPSSVVLTHALKRKRPVVYSYAIVTLARKFAALLGKKTKIEMGGDFWSSVAANYLNDVTGDIWAIIAMKFVLKFIGTRVAIIPSASGRTFPEVLACKLLGIFTIGIQHGAPPKYYFVSDFMPEFDGTKQISLDKYGVWSGWWKEYFVANSRAYRPEQLAVSGPMRPLERKNVSDLLPSNEKGLIKVLFVAEELAAPQEVMPYLEALISTEDLSLFIKFRPYHDGFEEWLKKNRPEILDKVEILRGDMHQAISTSHVVVGTYSAGVIESLLQLKPPVLFRTNKWGDCFELKSFDPDYRLFAENPQELVECVKRSGKIPKDLLKRLQERFFGNPYQNGSKWVVEEALKLL